MSYILSICYFINMLLFSLHCLDVCFISHMDKLIVQPASKLHTSVPPTCMPLLTSDAPNQHRNKFVKIKGVDVCRKDTKINVKVCKIKIHNLHKRNYSFLLI